MRQRGKWGREEIDGMPEWKEELKTCKAYPPAVPSPLLEFLMNYRNDNVLFLFHFIDI